MRDAEYSFTKLFAIRSLQDRRGFRKIKSTRFSCSRLCSPHWSIVPADDISYDIVWNPQRGLAPSDLGAAVWFARRVLRASSRLLSSTGSDDPKVGRNGCPIGPRIPSDLGDIKRWHRREIGKRALGDSEPNVASCDSHLDAFGMVCADDRSEALLPRIWA